MVSYSVSDNKVGAHEKTLVASTVDTVTFFDTLRSVEVVSDGAAALYFTVDGSTPTVGGEGCFYIPAGGGVRVVPTSESPTVVKLISSGTPKYSVARAV